MKEPEYEKDERFQSENKWKKQVTDMLMIDIIIKLVGWCALIGALIILYSMAVK